MLAGVLGVAGLVLGLFAVGGFMEGDMGKVGKFGTGFVLCSALILMTTGPHAGSGVQTCSIEWDGFSNSDACD